jgi:hypothetical protein
MKQLVVVVVVALGVMACGGEVTERAVEQPLYDCADPGSRFTCAPLPTPYLRWVCHKTGFEPLPYLKLLVWHTSAHVAGAHGDQAPGASANDVGGDIGLDCNCFIRTCEGACTGAANGETCDDGMPCTGDGACIGGACEPGPLEPEGTSCGDGEQCNAGGVCVAVNVIINEAESNGGVPGDWVELYNAGTTVAHVAGWTFKDSDDTHAYVLPAGTTIAPGAYLVLDEAQFGFGLGGADSVRLFDDVGLVDAYAWTMHAVTSYGRCPDGTGAFAMQTSSSKGAANDCSIPVRVNEVESSGGVPGDWVELVNTAAFAVDVGGWTFKDSDDTHAYVIPAGTTIGPGAFLVLDEAQFGFGLGGADSARIFDATSALVDAYAWTAHAATTYGRCPNGTGAFATQTSSSKGAPNDCAAPVRFNEVESNGGVPGDWVELFNAGPIAVDLSGWTFKDSDDTHAYVLPAGTSIASGGYLVLDEAQFGFGLGGADSARIFDASSTLVDSYAWTLHAPVTYGRCPNGTGAFAETSPGTKGAANQCGTTPTGAPWPGPNAVTALDVLNAGNISGLVHDGSVLWAVQNGPSTLFRIDGASVTSQPLVYAGGGGEPDAEDIAIGGDGAFYVATERDNAAGTVSRPSILRFVPGSGTLVATHEWNLAADLPVLGPNNGLEAITYVPDTYLVSIGFYNPALFPNHGAGLYFVGVEQTGMIYAYALDLGGGFARVAAFPSGDVTSKALSFDVTTGYLWQHCGAACGGQTRVLTLGAAGTVSTKQLFDRPTSMANLANEGIAIAPCSGTTRSFYWADDGNTSSRAIRVDSIPCGAFIP